MHPLLRPSGLLTVLILLLLAGCDSNESRRTGSFMAEVQGDLTTRLDGTAELFIQRAADSDEPVSFDIVLTAQQSEITIQSIEGSGAPQEVQYDVERTVTGTSSQVVRIEFDPDRLSSTSELFEAHSGVFTITKATDDVVEGEFNLDATGTDDPSAEVMLNGQFTAER